MSCNPCCCCGSLQRGVIILAVIETILALMNLGTRIFALIAATNDSISWGDKSDNGETATVVTLSVNIVFAVLSLLLALRLYFAARKRDKKNCTIWLIVTAIITAITIIVVVVNVTKGVANTVELVATSVDIVYNFYMMWCVYAFIQEIKGDRDAPINTA
ncbi:uncharacterized protein LOC110863683 [Folsomia candida]|nr:uncharacterized protein LOC110863683 [Folsomia candida]